MIDSRRVSEFEAWIAPLLQQLPTREADILFRYHILRETQAEIAATYGLTQAALSYLLSKSMKRINFILTAPLVTEEGMRHDLKEHFSPEDLNIFVLLWQTTCQSETAVELGLTQGKVRYRFVSALTKLDSLCEEIPSLEVYSRLFGLIRVNFCILKEVHLPKWSDRQRRKD